MDYRFVIIEERHGRTTATSVPTLEEAKQAIKYNRSTSYPIAVYDQDLDRLLLNNDYVLVHTVGKDGLIYYCRQALYLDLDYEFESIDEL